ncbi:hypothetical protein [Pseudomonas leptonychotis]|uniref:hypothetical protein n=1 Tax=Pseudomonas leptonychotis TaxID=2448482 RepID=UPI00386F770B
MTSDLKVFQIFKAGSHTTMGGATLEFTERDLATTVAVYQPALKKAPLCLGHPADDGPSFGEVVGMFVKDRVLYAQARVGTKLTDLVRKGSYGPVSAAFHHPQHPNNPMPGTYYLRHVGFLGAIPPAVKGLTRPQFAELGDAICFAEGYEQNALVSAKRFVRAGGSLDDDRETLHHLALDHQESHPELSYAESLQQLRNIESSVQVGGAIDEGRMALHDFAVNHQLACPELSYGEAIQHAMHVLTFN